MLIGACSNSMQSISLKCSQAGYKRTGQDDLNFLVYFDDGKSHTLIMQSMDAVNSQRASLLNAMSDILLK